MIDFAPISRATVDAFMRLYRELCPTVNDEVPISEFATRLGWDLECTENVALWLDERMMISTDRGLGTGITVIEGR